MTILKLMFTMIVTLKMMGKFLEITEGHNGGQNDGHEGCKGELVCGSNNCRKFGLYYHPKDDCCDEPSTLSTERPPPVIIPGVPLEPPSG